MRTLRLLSATAAILLLGAGAVSAQGMKTNDTSGVPAAQQNAPPEKMMPAGKSDQIKAPEKTGQATPTAPVSGDKQLTTDKGAPTGAAAKDATKGSADAAPSADVKSTRTARHGHDGGRYASSRRGPLYDSYRGDFGDRGCRHHRHHGWTPWLWC
jgi:hypothetical protein